MSCTQFLRLSTVISFICLISVTISSTIPKRSNDLTTIYGEASNNASEIYTLSDGLTKRETWLNIYCGCGIGLDATYTNNVVNDISSSQTISLGGNQARLVFQGNVVAFACNFAANTQGILGVQFKIAVQQQVSPVCGGFIAGTWENFDTNIVLGYMRYGGESTSQICGAARSSPRNIHLPDGSTPLVC